MLDKKLLFHTQGDMIPDSCNTNSNRLASDSRVPGSFFSSSETNTMNYGFSAVDPTFTERGAASHDNTYCYSPGNMSQMKYDLSPAVNSWLTVENLDDIDKVFRNCGPTFELGGTGNDHELSWQSLSHAVEESEDGWTSNFSFFHPDSRETKNKPEEYGPSKLENGSTSASVSNKDPASISSGSSFLACKGGGLGNPDYSTFTNPSHAISVTEEDTMLTEPGDFSEKLQSNQLDGRRQNQCAENSGLFHNNGSNRLDLALPFGNSSCQAFTSSDIQRQKNSTQFDPFGYLLNHVPQMQVDYNCSDQTHFSPTSSEMKSSSTPRTSIPLLETSYRSNQVLLTGRSCGRPLEVPTVPANDNKESCEWGFCPLPSSNPKHVYSHAIFRDPVLVPQEYISLQKEIENHTDSVRVSVGVLTNSVFAGVEESSFMSTGLGEESMEEYHFCQLQNVVAQLDTGTRLRIRDGLLRLARNAKQRQNCAILNGCSIDDRDTGGEKKDNGFLDMETDTNPIDRSIAHLLFHRAG